MKELTHISLFAGIGGIDLAAEWAGFRTILFVEIDPYCQKVLRKHWPEVSIIGDIRDATKEEIMDIAHGGGCVHGQTKKQSAEARVKALGKSEPRGEYGVPPRRISTATITLITGGFPCQPVSQAGKRRGKTDDRWLWPEMLRVISEVRPTWVVAENVAGLLNMGFNDCVSDLESEGYETIPFLIPACGVNAPHRRDRIFIVAHTEQPRVRRECGEANNQRRETSQEGGESLRQRDREIGTGGINPTDNDVSNTPSIGCYTGGSNRERGHILPDQGITKEGKQTGQRWFGRVSKVSEDVANAIIGAKRSSLGERGNTWGANSKQDNRNSLGDDIRNGSCEGKGWWAVEPELGRVAYGIPNRVDRLKCLGNAVVPQQIYPILQAIADIERTIHITPKC